MTFCVKGYSRVYVPLPELVSKVENIIKIMDPFEAEYMPKDLVTTWSGSIDLVYNGKFELDPLELMAVCWNAGIRAFFVTQEQEYNSYKPNPRMDWEIAKKIWETALEAAQDAPGNLGENDAIAAIQYGYEKYKDKPKF